MTKIALASDLHIEFERHGEPGRSAAIGPPHPRLGPDLSGLRGAADLLVLAGDIDLGADGVGYAEEAAEYLGVPVVYVAGNHEAYRQDLETVLAACRARAADASGRVLFLERDAVEVAGLRVLGCTLWTDYEIYGDVREGMRAAESMLVDHRLITCAGRPFMPYDALVRHRAARSWLERELAAGAGRPTLVVTHHAPLRAAVEPRFEGSPLTPAFVSDLEPLVMEHRPAAWVWGHTHHSQDFVTGATRCVSAQRGYPGESAAVAGFRPALFEV